MLVLGIVAIVIVVTGCLVCAVNSNRISSYEQYIKDEDQVKYLENWNKSHKRKGKRK